MSVSDLQCLHNSEKTKHFQIHTQKPNTQPVRYRDLLLLRLYGGHIAVIFQKEENVEFKVEFKIRLC
jgi:hypothetical protein